MSAISNVIWNFVRAAMKDRLDEHVQAEIEKSDKRNERIKLKFQHIDRHIDYNNKPVMLLIEGDILMLRFGFFTYTLSDDADNHKPDATHGLFHCVDTGEVYKVPNKQKIALYDPVTLGNLDRMCAPGLALAFSYATNNLTTAVQLPPFMHYEHNNNGFRSCEYFKKLTPDEKQKSLARYEDFKNQYVEYIVSKALRSIDVHGGFIKQSWKTSHGHAICHRERLKAMIGNNVYTRTLSPGGITPVAIEVIEQRAGDRFMVSQAYRKWAAGSSRSSAENDMQVLDTALEMVIINELLLTLRAS